MTSKCDSWTRLLGKHNLTGHVNRAAWPHTRRSSNTKIKKTFPQPPPQTILSALHFPGHLTLYKHSLYFCLLFTFLYSTHRMLWHQVGNLNKQTEGCLHWLDSKLLEKFVMLVQNWVDFYSNMNALIAGIYRINIGLNDL